MNATLSYAFLTNLPKAIREMHEPIRMKQLNTVFLYMFNCFVTKYGKTTTENHEENSQRMATDWHPSDGFKPLATCLIIGASYASAARYPMDNCDVINIVLRVIKRLGMYSEEYKNWITRENQNPPIAKTIDSFIHSLGGLLVTQEFELITNAPSSVGYFHASIPSFEG